MLYYPWSGVCTYRRNILQMTTIVQAKMSHGYRRTRYILCVSSSVVVKQNLKAGYSLTSCFLKTFRPLSLYKWIYRTRQSLGNCMGGMEWRGGFPWFTFAVTGLPNSSSHYHLSQAHHLLLSPFIPVWTHTFLLSLNPHNLCLSHNPVYHH